MLKNARPLLRLVIQREGESYEDPLRGRSGTINLYALFSSSWGKNIKWGKEEGKEGVRAGIKSNSMHTGIYRSFLFIVAPSIWEKTKTWKIIFVWNGLMNLLKDMICLWCLLVMDISANWTLNIAKVCLEFAIYDVQLPDISLTNFVYNF